MTKNLFAGTGTLTRFIFKRDRIRLAIWVLGLAAFCIVLVPVFQELLIGETDGRVMSTMMENPAMVAIVGPVYGSDNYTTGAAYGNMMLVFSVMIAGAMNIFMVSRHTRQDEEQGRLEVIRSLPVGRLANLASVLLVALAANAALAIFTGLGLYAVRADGMALSGCMLFGAAMGVIGMFFAASTAVLCQCTANNRTALGLSLGLMLALYMLRAAGDMGTEALSLISPLGLILRTQSFVNDYWWPVWVICGILLAMTALAFALARIRDLGRGLVPEKSGRRHASGLLGSPYGLAAKLLRTPIIVWSVTVFILAAMYGSVFGELESFIGSNDMLKMIFAQTPGFTLTEQFISLMMVIMTMISVIPILSFVNRVAVEEKNGHTEHILGRSASRYDQMAAWLLPAFIMSIVLQLLSALGFWSVGSMVLDTTPSLETFIVSALSYLPAMWVMLGVSLALAAFLPNLVSLGYVYLGYTFVSIYLGTIAGFPEWIRKLTPFGYIPKYPLEELEILPLIALTVIAAALMVSGFVGYRRRDMRAM